MLPFRVQQLGIRMAGCSNTSCNSVAVEAYAESPDSLGAKERLTRS
ncbi:hypothetical protein [Synechococcus sp. M16CYN]